MSDSSRPVSSRRHFLKLASGAVVAIPLAGRVARAEAEKVSEDDPTAVALGYKHDASEVDTEAFPKRAGEEGSAQYCYNCALYAGAPDAEWGPCPIFANKLVAREGWCNSWVPKA